MIRICEEDAANTAILAEISIAFQVEHIFEIGERDGLGPILIERPVQRPFRKDYDEAAGNGPSQWPIQFDLSNWCLLTAIDGEEPVGGCLIAFDSKGVDMLEGRCDLAVIWDIRVQPERRGAGIGCLLLNAVISWAKSKGCKELKVETQNINVPACRFYERSGFRLRAANRNVYPDFPDEVQLIWTMPLALNGQ